MIIYIEKQALKYSRSQKILKQFKSAQIIEIDHYKNVFDKKTAGLNEKKSLIIAELRSPAITEAPEGYGHTRKAYFFKTSLNCVYDCDYCFLKGAFKTEHMVFFVNYDDIKKQIYTKIQELQNSFSSGDTLLQSEKKQEDIWFYSSDYSDVQGMDSISGFNEEFIEFFEQFNGVKMEIRTKSGNIKSLLDLGYTPKNTEIAFSLNPQILIDRYENGTASLTQRIGAMNALLDKGFKVGTRLLPLLPVQNYKDIYRNFFRELGEQIIMKNIYSSFAAGLLFTKNDYKVMLGKYPTLDILHYLEKEGDDFYRESREVRDWFYKEIKTLDNKCLLCLEN